MIEANVCRNNSNKSNKKAEVAEPARDNSQHNAHNPQSAKRKVILVTDGDGVAQSAVELATHNVGGRCISMSGGNPTPISGQMLADLIRSAEHDPVVVMVDDRGYEGEGEGEQVMEYILQQPDFDILGIVAVSSNGKDCYGINVDFSITNDGTVVQEAVDKEGNPTGTTNICGDTLSILEGRKDILIVGIGDPGKMEFKDEIVKGAPVTTKALQEIIKRTRV